MIQADPARLSQILLNLLSNAVKFTQAGLITLGADVEPPYVHFWVADTGVGLPAGLDFRDIPSMGLQLVDLLVKQLRGSMNIDSRQNGTEFLIQFPAR
jgi:signal transduction histidine kinase